MAKKKNNSNINNAQAKAVTAAPRAASKGPQATSEKSFLHKYSHILVPTGIALITFLFLYTCTNNKFTNWDDIGYVTSDQYIKNSSWEGIKTIFSTSTQVMGNYHPLTIITYAFEYSYIGLQPFLYHLDNLLFHILCTLAVYLFVKVFTGRMVAAGVAALLFGLHPMHIESVAWVAGRKDLLYGTFFMLSLTTYVLYLRATGSKRTMWYILGIVLFALSLLAKSVAVTLPVTLFLFDYYEQRKLHLKLLLEKIPHFGLSLLFGLLSVQAQTNIGALGKLDVHFNPIERIALGCYALTTYLWKLVVPVGLSNFYPYPLKEADSLPASYYAYVIIIAALIAVIIKFARHNKMVVFGTLFFTINIALLLQFIPVGGAIMSDRYGYIPYLGFFLIAGWFVSEHFTNGMTQTGKVALGGTLAYCLVLGYMAHARCEDWYDSYSLWSDDSAKHPESPIAYFYLGQDYSGRFENATDPNDKKIKADSTLFFYNMSIQRKPDYINPIICVGELQRTVGMIDDAKITYYRAMNINPKNENVYLGMGIVFSIKHQFDSAEYCFRKALSLKPYYPEGHSNYANFLDIIGQTDSSLYHYQMAIDQNPDATIPYLNRARIYLRLQRFNEALKDYDHVLAITPENGDALVSRSRAYASKGDKAHALQDVEMAIKLGYKNIDPAYYQQLKQ